MSGRFFSQTSFRGVRKGGCLDRFNKGDRQLVGFDRVAVSGDDLQPGIIGIVPSQLECQLSGAFFAAEIVTA